MQRLHVDDLVGHVLQREDWTVLNLPAIAPERQEVTIGDGEIQERKIVAEIRLDPFFSPQSF